MGRVGSQVGVPKTGIEETLLLNSCSPVTLASCLSQGSHGA